MPFDLKSSTTTLALAFLWGIVNSLDLVLVGAPTSAIVVSFFGSAILGTLIAAGVSWVILALLRKKHLQITVLNWVLLLGIGLALLVLVLRISGLLV
ncbi:MAG: hypothetical protein GYB25_14175 [Rhodobacteraceae bacterium]|nr:hypothetical protein [Paracoccaceae bacterium]